MSFGDHDALPASRGLAAEYDAARFSGPLRDVLIAYRMLRKRGLHEVAAHAGKIALMRVHVALFDQALESRLPRAPRGEAPREATELRTVMPREVDAAIGHAPVPSKSMEWALLGLSINFRDYDFVDIGSGRGCAVVRAAMLPFKRVIGVEFAEAYHHDACVNTAWARDNGLVCAGSVELRHQSALETELPFGPCILFLFAPFRDVVMRPFLDRVDASVRQNPRPMIAVYVNPMASGAFSRPTIVKRPLAWRYRALIAMLSPHAVEVYSWKAPEITITSTHAGLD